MKKILYTIFILLIAINVKATKHIVTSTGDDADSPTVGMLRYAVENASNGDTIIFNVATVTLDTAIRISGGILTIDGGVGVIIDGNNKDQVFSISCYSSSDDIMIKNLTIQNGRIESSTAMGGGMYLYIMSGNVKVDNCTFKNNTVVSSADGQGGALRASGGTFTNCFFLNNEVFGTGSFLGGGGIYSIGGTFINCVIAGNNAKYGGGIYSSTSSEYINCTITQNNASNSDAGGGVSCENNCSFTNNILYNNKANNVENNIDNYLGTSSFSYCAVESANSIVGSNGNIGLTVTPFTHAGDDSLSIYQGSVCENKGTTSGTTVLSYDIAGNNRIYDSAIDIGAYEYINPLIVSRTDDNLNNPKIGMLRYAIECAGNGDTITFDVDSIIADTTFTFGTKSVSIIGSNSKNVEILGDFSFTLFYIHTKVDTIRTELKNLTFKNGGGECGGLGGLFNYNAVIENCNFIDNIGTLCGGAYVRYAEFLNCNVINNKITGAGSYGVGGLYANGAIISDCDIINNGSYNDKSTTRYGGLKASICEITNCRIINNYSNTLEGAGGANVSDSELTNCYFYKNHVKQGVQAFAGGVKSDNSTFINCIFKENIGAEFDGGIVPPRYSGGVSAEGGNFINCLFDGNKGKCVGGLYSGSSFGGYINMNIINCTFTGNIANSDETGGFHLFGDYGVWNGAITAVKNTVAYGNYPNNYICLTDSIEFTYCAIQDTLVEGEGNIKLNESPFEYSNTEDSYFIKENSLCVDAGDTVGISNILNFKDLIGNDRINNDTIDIGAIEYKQRITPVVNWPTTSEIQYGDFLYRAINDDGSANISGYFVYDSLAILDADEHKIEIVFSPIADSVYNYKSVGDSLTINVNKTNLTVSAEDTVIKYGAEEPKYTLQYTGFVFNDNSTVIDNKPDAAVLNYQSLNAGIYPGAIVVSGGSDNNYEFIYQNGTLNIGKANLNVIVVDTAITFGESEPVYRIEYNGFVNGENIDVVDTKPITNVQNFEFLNAGDHTDIIQVSGGTDNNYELIYQNGTLTIDKALLTVTAQDTVVKLGDTEPNYRLTYTGFVKNEDINVLDVLPVASVNNYASLNTGVHNDVITVSGGNDNNYEFNYISGTLIINKSTSIRNLSKYDLLVYPNPTKSVITIEANKSYQVKLLDIQGTVLLEKSMTNKILKFDLSPYPNGVYILHLIKGSELIVKKIIKE